MLNFHILFIGLHALSGVIAFIAGWVTIVQLSKKPAATLLWLFLSGLVGLVVFMFGAILVDWSQLGNMQRFIYLGLLLLGLYMLFRAYQAFTVQKKLLEGWKSSYVDHVGFTLISLFDGFVIVSAIDLGLPTWSVVVVSVLGVAVGIYAINRTKTKITSSPDHKGENQMQYHQFIGKVQNRARLGTAGEAVYATRATLEVLGKRLQTGGAEKLATALPSEVQTYLTDGRAGRSFGLDEFFEQVSEHENVDLPEAVQHARAVVSVVQEAVSQGEIKNIRAQLPEEYDPLFESGSEGKMYQEK
jgi:uncharacterized protein (DUF2267 family)